MTFLTSHVYTFLLTLTLVISRETCTLSACGARAAEQPQGHFARIVSPLESTHVLLRFLQGHWGEALCVFWRTWKSSCKRSWCYAGHGWSGWGGVLLTFMWSRLLHVLMDAWCENATAVYQARVYSARTFQWCNRCNEGEISPQTVTWSGQKSQSLRTQTWADLLEDMLYNAVCVLLLVNMCIYRYIYIYKIYIYIIIQ